MHLIPLVIPEISTSSYYSHIYNLSNTADQFFGQEINRSLPHVCKKGVEIGVIIPDFFIDMTSGKEFNNCGIVNEEITYLVLDGSQPLSLVNYVSIKFQSRFMNLDENRKYWIIIRNMGLPYLKKASQII